ncbi:MAG: hypothetical protein ACK58C_20445 [Betaproteobacteria bacterium]
MSAAHPPPSQERLPLAGLRYGPPLPGANVEGDQLARVPAGESYALGAAAAAH